jgi:fermentation-respiration switch protein FrsA (DUF1100 family)
MRSPDTNLYFPMLYPMGYWNTSSYGLTVEDVFLTAADGTKLHGWWIQGQEDAPTMLFFHANAGNITHRIDNLLRWQKRGLNIFILDYRGYGRSEGSPHEAGIYQDAEAAYAYVCETRGIAPEQVVLFGRSLGGAVALYTASKFPGAGVIVESTFTCLQDLAAIFFPGVDAQLFQGQYESLERVKNLTIPLLVVHGTRDDLVPVEQGKKLFAAHSGRIGKQKQLYLIEDAGHNDTYYVGGEAYFETLERFIRRVCSNPWKLAPSSTSEKA